MEQLAAPSSEGHEGAEANRRPVSGPAPAVKPLAAGWFSRSRFYSLLGKHPERAFVFITLAAVVFINVAAPQKISFINFYFLPVIVSGYLADTRTSVTGSLLCILLVTLNALIAPELFSAPTTGLELSFHIMAWGGFLLLAGYAVGHQREKNRNLEDKERLATVVGLSALAECRDEATGKHLLRIRSYTEILARSLATKKPYRGYLHEDRIGDLLMSCVLHDIGKVAVPDQVLLKEGPLTEQEFSLVKLHPEKGRATIKEIHRQVGRRTYLEMAEMVALSHHERWDGAGYPTGLRGQEIPLSARIVTLADVYDAITTKRPYKEAFSHAEARDFILQNREKMFDPDVVDAFTASEEDFARVASNFCDLEPIAGC